MFYALLVLTGYETGEIEVYLEKTQVDIGLFSEIVVIRRNVNLNQG